MKTRGGADPFRLLWGVSEPQGECSAATTKGPPPPSTQGRGLRVGLGKEAKEEGNRDQVFAEGVTGLPGWRKAGKRPLSQTRCLTVEKAARPLVPGLWVEGAHLGTPCADTGPQPWVTHWQPGLGVCVCHPGGQVTLTPDSGHSQATDPAQQPWGATWGAGTCPGSAGARASRRKHECACACTRAPCQSL